LGAATRRRFVMSAADVVVLAVTVVALAGLGWFFFGPRRARSARLEDGVQRVEVTVRGGHVCWGVGACLTLPGTRP
jgi:hypothetical protein